MKAVNRLLPVVGFDQQFKQGDEARDTNHGPVDWDEQCPQHQSILLASQTGEQVQVHVEEIAEDETHRTSIKNGCRKQNVIDRCD